MYKKVQRESQGKIEEKAEIVPEENEIKEVGELELLHSKLEEAEKKAEDQYDQLLRTKAEFQNYKKRVEKEKNGIIQYAGEKILRELILSIIDNLERTISHTTEPQNIKAIVEGIELILNQLKKDLERFGVKQIESLGKLFDPTRHEAVARTLNAEIPENTITEEIQKGYLYNDKLLRPAKVCVSTIPQEQEEGNKSYEKTSVEE
ncbi:MAG: nucleotide exchange factor GrpE [Thermodesulfobacteriota bacterium]|nr:nucleotide exchange factor GrpE [Thermodesulfobacteriota bacterium]